MELFAQLKYLDGVFIYLVGTVCESQSKQRCSQRAVEKFEQSAVVLVLQKSTATEEI